MPTRDHCTAPEWSRPFGVEGGELVCWIATGGGGDSPVLATARVLQGVVDSSRKWGGPVAVPWGSIADEVLAPSIENMTPRICESEITECRELVRLRMVTPNARF